jgi:hypothetical protein
MKLHCGGVGGEIDLDLYRFARVVDSAIGKRRGQQEVDMVSEVKPFRLPSKRLVSLITNDIADKFTDLRQRWSHGFRIMEKKSERGHTHAYQMVNACQAG